MEKINKDEMFRTQSSRQQDLDQLNQRLLAQLKENPLVQRLVNQYQLSDEVLNKNMVSLDLMIEANEKCNGCQGLAYCRQPLQGKVFNVQMEQDVLMECYEDCRYSKEYDAKFSHRQYFDIADMDEEDFLLDFKTISLEGESEEYLRAYMQVDRSLDSDKGIYLYGHTGVGKTYLMESLANEYAKRKQRVCFCRVPLLMQNFYRAMNDQEELNTLLKRLYRADVVFLDDIGAGTITAFTRDSLLFPVLDERLTKNKKTYFTSNLSMDDLALRYSGLQGAGDSAQVDRLMDRIRALSEIVILKGESRR